MNRKERRAGRIRGPKGEWLYPELLLVVDRDEKGRPKTLQMTYDEQKIGDVVPEERRDKVEMLLVYTGGETAGYSN